MKQDAGLENPSAFQARHARLIERLFVRACAPRWGLSRERFAEALRRSAERRFRGAAPAHAAIETYLESLHVEDLALACACSEGSQAAWDFFVAEYSPKLRAAARTILHGSGASDEVRADDLADQMYAELFGTEQTADGRRKSLLLYFHGRSKLSTWLHTVLAQRHVDGLRAAKRHVSLDFDADGEPQHPAARRADPPAQDPDRARYLELFDAALAAAIAQLTSRDRLRLAYYYADELTLAQTGRLLGEHEATASRQLERTRRELREQVERALAQRRAAENGSAAAAGLSAAQIELAFEYALEGSALDLSRALARGSPGAERRGS